MYIWLKLVHVIAVVAFLGNIATGLFWHAHAVRKRDPALLAHTMQGIIRSDRLFTLPGVLVIVAAGIGTAMAGHVPILRTGWILWTLVLFAISGVVFSVFVAPLQRRLSMLAEEGRQSGTFDYAAYRGRARRWESWGALALLTPLAGVALMVLKPAL